MSKFAVQTANQCYDMMVTKHAMSSIGMEMERVVIQQNNNEIDRSDIVTDSDEISVAFSGKYSLVVINDILECMKRNDNIYVSWSFDKKNIKKDNVRFCLNEDLVRVLVRKINDIHETGKVGGITVTGYTRATITTNDGNKIILYAHPCFQGNPCYDWAYVHFQEISADGIEVENHYPSRIIGFIELDGRITGPWFNVQRNHYFGQRLKLIFLNGQTRYIG